MKLTTDAEYQRLLGRISDVYAIGQKRADYGTGLLASLSRDLTLRHGKGFSRSNVVRIRQFYLAHPKGATLPHPLSWAHTRNKDERLAESATCERNRQRLVQKYQLSLPGRNALRREREQTLPKTNLELVTWLVIKENKA